MLVADFKAVTQLGAVTDTGIKAVLDNPGSETVAALNEKYVARQKVRQTMPKLLIDEQPTFTFARFWCASCGHGHTVGVTGPGAWGYNGDDEKPTLTPSVLVYERRKTDGSIYSPRCHSFVRDGRIEYLGDCGHELAGQTVDLLELSDWPGPVY